jgi:hypothetical protein
MIDLKLDDAGNVVIENSDLAFVTEDDEVAQSIRIRLRTWLGEWFLDKDYGVNWLGRVFKRPFSQTQARKEIERIINGTVGVKRTVRVTQSISNGIFTFAAEVVTANNQTLFVGDDVRVS